MHLAFISFWLLQLRSVLRGRAMEFGCILQDVCYNVILEVNFGQCSFQKCLKYAQM